MSALVDAVNATELQLEHNDEKHVLTVRLNREHRLNAMSENMGNELVRLCDVLTEDQWSTAVR